MKVNNIIDTVKENSNIVSSTVRYSSNNWIAGIIRLLEKQQNIINIILSASTWGQHAAAQHSLADYFKENTSIETFS